MRVTIEKKAKKNGLFTADLTLKKLKMCTYYQKNPHLAVGALQRTIYNYLIQGLPAGNISRPNTSWKMARAIMYQADKAQSISS